MRDRTSARWAVYAGEANSRDAAAVQQYRMALHQHGLEPHGASSRPSLVVFQERTETITWFLEVLLRRDGNVPTPSSLGHGHFVHARLELQRSGADRNLIAARSRAMAWLYDVVQDLVPEQQTEVKGVR